MCSRRMLALVIPVILVGCSTWATSTGPVPGVAAQHQGDHLRVKVADGEPFDLYDVETVGDSLVGRSEAGDRYAVALDEIQYVQVQETDKLKTGLLMGGIIVGAIFLLAFVATAVGTASLAGEI
jgi:hypothetical protein